MPRKCDLPQSEFWTSLDPSGWLTIEELSSLTGWTYDAIHKRIHRRKFQYIRQVQARGKARGGRNGKIWQIHILDPAIPEKVRVQFFRGGEGGGQVVVASGVKEGEGSKDEASDKGRVMPMGEKGHEIGLKIQAVQLFLVLREAHRGKDLVRLVEETLIPEFRARGLRRISLKSLYRWARLYEKYGAEAFWPKRRERGVMAFDSEALRYGIGLYLRKENLTAKAAYAFMVQKAKEMGWRVGSYATFCRVLQEIPEGVKALARKGERYYRANFLPKIYRRYDDLMPNEIWVLDHTALNIMVWKDEKREEVIRPWITAAMDLRTRMIAGFVVVRYPSSDSIALMMRKALLPKEPPGLPGYEALDQEFYWPIYGVPQELYMDHGRDFKSGRFWAYHKEKGWRQVSEMAYRVTFDGPLGALEGLGIRPRFAIPYQAWAKPIERWFREVKKYIQTLPGGWPNRKHMSEQDRTRVAEALRAGTLLTLQELQAILEYWVAFEYHTRPHEGLPERAGRRLSPLEMWEELRPEIGIVEVKPRALDFLLMKTQNKKVFKDGIHLLGFRYQHDALAPYIGKSVTVYYDPMDVSRVYVYVRGRYICTAYSVEGVRMKRALGQITERDLRSAMREKRKIEKRDRELVKFYAAGVEVPSPLEQLLMVKNRLKKQRRVAAQGGGRIVKMTSADRLVRQMEKGSDLEKLQALPEDDIILWQADLEE